MINHNIFNKILDKVELVHWKQKITTINQEYRCIYTIYREIDGRFICVKKCNINLLYIYRSLNN